MYGSGAPQSHPGAGFGKFGSGGNGGGGGGSSGFPGGAFRFDTSGMGDGRNPFGGGGGDASMSGSLEEMLQGLFGFGGGSGTDSNFGGTFGGARSPHMPTASYIQVEFFVRRHEAVVVVIICDVICIFCPAVSPTLPFPLG